MPHEYFPVVPEVLTWARERSGYTIASAATALKIKRNELLAVENGSPISGSLFRKMESVYGLPESILLFPFRPNDDPLPRDFRSSNTAKTLTPLTLKAIHEARRIQHFLTDLRNEDETLIPAATRPDVDGRTSAINVARQERARLGITVETQNRWTKKNAFRHWATALQSRGVFVLLKKMTWDDARGICLADNGEVPMIIVNDDDNEGARCFTLFHEYAHFLRGQTATCLEDQRRSSEAGRIEAWCDRFAAEFLMPASSLRASMFKHVKPEDYELYHVRRLASAFKVSVHAMAFRLDELGISDFYRTNRALVTSLSRRKKAAKKPGKGGGSISAAHSRFLELGSTTASVLLTAIRRGIADPYETAGVLRLNPQALDELDYMSRTAPA